MGQMPLKLLMNGSSLLLLMEWERSICSFKIFAMGPLLFRFFGFFAAKLSKSLLPWRISKLVASHIRVGPKIPKLKQRALIDTRRRSPTLSISLAHNQNERMHQVRVPKMFNRGQRMSSFEQEITFFFAPRIPHSQGRVEAPLRTPVAPCPSVENCCPPVDTFQAMSSSGTWREILFHKPATFPTVRPCYKWLFEVSIGGQFPFEPVLE